MKILVLGGTGAMGVHVVSLLAERRDQVTVTTRQLRKSDSNIKYIQGNAHDLNFLKELLVESWDAIIDFMVYSTPELKERVNDLLATTSQYVYLSSARVYADSVNPITEESARLLDVLEDQEYLATDEYALSKARQENILRESGKKNWTIIRPYITYSENRLQLGVLEKEEWLYRALHGRTIVFSKEIASKITTLTYGFDVAKGIVAILTNEKALGNAFHITVDEHHKWEEIFQSYLSVLEMQLGQKPKYILLDADKFLELRPVIYQVKYDRLFNRQFDNTKINEFINCSDFKPSLSGMEHCLNEFLLQPDFKYINWRSEAFKDKVCKEYTSIKEIKGVKAKVKYFLYRNIL